MFCDFLNSQKRVIAKIFKMKKSILRFPFYLFVFPIYYVLNMFAQNVSEIQFGVVLRPVLMVSLIAIILFTLARLVFKKISPSSFFAFFLLCLFLFYGAIYVYLRAHPVFGINLGKHVFLGIIGLAITSIVFLLLFLRKVTIKDNFAVFMNITTGGLLIFACISIISGSSKYGSANLTQTALPEDSAQQAWLNGVSRPIDKYKQTVLPDIYYIIPDMFARSDAIKNETGYDNSEFLAELMDLGFYVAQCSRSNYASTQLSIASSINFNYLDQIQDGITDREMLVNPMSDSLLQDSLESLGYQVVVFENGFGLPELRNANFSVKINERPYLIRPYNAFENLLVNNSILRVFYDVNLEKLSRLYDKIFFPYRDHVNIQKNIFEQLPKIEAVRSPKFVFVHIMMPHPPYLIRADGTVETDSRYYREALGQPVSEELYIEGYLMQVQYVQNRLINAVIEILDESETNPVIVIQGDHGIRYENRLDILNAYYAPPEIQANLYPTITPVNTFRVLLDGLFGTDYGLLEDISWYSEYPEWFEMQIDPEHNPSCQLGVEEPPH